MVVSLFFFTVIVHAETFSDARMGYSVDLPQNWTRIVTTDSQHIFADTSGQFKSEVAIVKHDFTSSLTLDTPEDWTRANFIAYAFSVDADAFSVLSFYDTVSAKQNGTLWAADAYSYFFDPDTSIGNWAEYIRFTATGKRGYEIYALGPMDDMDSNVVTYAQIIENIVVLDSIDAPIRTARPHAAIRSGTEGILSTTDLLGRTVHSRAPLPSRVMAQSKRVRLFVR